MYNRNNGRENRDGIGERHNEAVILNRYYVRCRKGILQGSKGSHNGLRIVEEPLPITSINQFTVCEIKELKQHKKSNDHDRYKKKVNTLRLSRVISRNLEFKIHVTLIRSITLQDIGAVENLRILG